MRRGIGVAAAAALLLAGCSSSSDESVSTSTTTTVVATTTVATAAGACGAPTELEAGSNVRTISSAGGERTYTLWVPDAYDTSEPVPVVFTLHGSGSNKEQQIVYSGFTPLAQRDGVLVVAPDALGEPMAWAPYGVLREQEDLVFIDDIITDLSDVACVDPDRLWATGMSSGGLMTSALACSRSDAFSAFGPVAFTMYNPGECDDAGPVPIISFHGTADGVVPFDGGGIGGRGVNAVMEDWAEHNGCDETPTEERIGDDVVRRFWTGCDATTEQYIVEGGGHTWPGGIDLPVLGSTTRTISATEILWDLFMGDSTDS